MTDPRQALYAEADQQAAAVVAAVGLACPTGCGACCVTLPPHVSLGDLAPIAAAAIVDGTAEAILARAVAGATGPCALYDPTRPGGGCTVYPLRPVVCRLFGAGAVRDKRGGLALAVCRVHQAADPATVQRAQAYVDGGGAVPAFAEFHERAQQCDDGAAAVLPINQALAIALGRALLHAQLRAEAALTPPGTELASAPVALP
ncbi:MAG: YkgJ family cysteine cluster protein [Kofleriaceae bacterium]